MKLQNLTVKIFADGADREGMLAMAKRPFIKGLTTNPTLMNKAGVRDYKAFALDILSEVRDKPISFEVFSDDFMEMERQANEIASWAENVYVKIPVTNTQRVPSLPLIARLSSQHIKVNVTAIMTADQVCQVVNSLAPSVPSYVSVFAGRIADTGRDPLPIMKESLGYLKVLPTAELIWASPRELYNIIQADEIGCQIITSTNDIIKKLDHIGYDLEDFSLDTVKMFHSDARAAGYSL